MNKKVGPLVMLGALVSSFLGILGSICVASGGTCCIASCLGGFLISILGIGMVGFLYKNSVIFIIVGALLFLIGGIIMFRKKNISCGCNTNDNKNESCCPSDSSKNEYCVESNNVKEVVKKAYGKIANDQSSGCSCGCKPDTKKFAQTIGYTKEELNNIPEEANLGLGCGNPTAFAGLKSGETVLDLGSGAGFDCFIAASKVGPSGKVIGVDMTPEMIKKAKDNAKKNKVSNVDFRLGEIENLPIEDNLVDIVISNCVINLSADKPKVFKEIYRVLKPGGRISISDIALKKPLPDKLAKSIEAYVGCVAGAILIDEYKTILENSHLKNIKITSKNTSACISLETTDPIGKAILSSLDKNETIDNYITSVTVEGYK